MRPSTSMAYSATSSGWQFLMVSVSSFPSFLISSLSDGVTSFSPLSHFQLGVSLKSSHLNVAAAFGFTCWSLSGFTIQSLMISVGDQHHRVSDKHFNSSEFKHHQEDLTWEIFIYSYRINKFIKFSCRTLCASELDVMIFLSTAFLQGRLKF